MNYKGCVVVQGPINIEALPKIKECFRGYQLIHSCWEGNDTSLFDETDIVLINKIPNDSGPGNYLFQRENTLRGLDKAEELGWTRALKWRSDMWCTNVDGLWDMFESDKLNLYYWVEHISGYITDFFMEGDISDIKTLFSSEVPNYRYKHTEFILTLMLFTTGLYRKTVFMGSKLNPNCDVYWAKRKCWFSSNQREEWYLDYFPYEGTDWLLIKEKDRITKFDN
jgi:hypothetical protein